MKQIVGFILLLFFAFTCEVKAQTINKEQLNDTIMSIPELLEGIDKFVDQQPYTNPDTTGVNYCITLCTTIIQSNREPYLPDAYRIRGLLNELGRNTKQAISDFKKGIELDSFCTDCYLRLHWQYGYGVNNHTEAFKLWKKATRRFEKLVATDTTNMDATLCLFLLYDMDEYNQTAKTNARRKQLAYKLVQLDSTVAANWWRYANFFDYHSSAIEHLLVKAVALDPNESIYWNSLAYYYSIRKDITKVMMVIDSHKPRGANGIEYWYQEKANYYWRLGFKKEAIATAKEAKGLGYEIVYQY